MNAGAPDAPGACVREEFAAFVRSLGCGDLSAVRMARDGRRILPGTYPDQAVREIRSRVEALDFERALELLEPADRLAASAVGDELTHRILIVDDVRTTIHVLRSMLEGVGSLRFAMSSAQALQIADQWQPDLVLCDVHLDERSGLDICRELKRAGDGLEPAVILISAQADVASEVAALTAGADDFIEKPLQIGRVMGRVQTQLARRTRASALAARGAARLMPQHLGFITCQLDGRIVDLSPTLARAIGGPPDGTRQRLDQLLAAPAAGELARLLSDAVRSRRLEPTDASLAVDGASPLPVRLTGWMAPGVGGQVLWIVVEDLRARIVGERRKFDTAVSRAVMAMCGGIAHEFNNILNIVDGHLQLAAELLGAEHPARARIDKAGGALDRATALSGRMGLVARKFDNDVVATPAVLVDRLWALLCAGVNGRAPLVQHSGGGDCPIRVQVSGLRTALESLLDNACDAVSAAASRTIVVRSHDEVQADGAVFGVIEIEDHGTGMTEDIRASAFDPFFTTRAPNRAGLGLTEVRAFVQSCGGTIELLPVDPCGTLVRLRFPACGAPAGGAAA